MPSKQVAPGEYRDIAHPINAEARQIFTDAILAEYEKELANGPKEDSEEEDVEE